MQDIQLRDKRWQARRTQLIEDLSPVVRAQYPNASWKELLALVETAADTKLLYERFGMEP
jgi:hypothetical protein